MKLYHIVAMAENRVIGKDGKLPWHFSEDLKRFKRLTMGSTIIMGRKTFESIGSKPLPGRENFVVSRSKPIRALNTTVTARSEAFPHPSLRAEGEAISGPEIASPSARNDDATGVSSGTLKNQGEEHVHFFESIEEAIKAVRTDKVFIIGGAEIFRQTIDLVDGIYLTLVKAHYDGDAFYPEIPKRFREKERTAAPENPKLEYLTYEK